MDNFLKVAIKATSEAGKTFKRYFGKPSEVSSKGGNPADLVTEIDTRIELLLKRQLSKSFPDHLVVGEELGRIKSKNLSDYLWIIDPIDGTINYTKGIPYCCISVALFYKNQPIVGVVYNPVTNDWYTGEVGKGAYHNHKRIYVSKTRNLAHAFGGLGWGKNLKLGSKLAGIIMPKVRQIRVTGSTALNLCQTAQGKFDFFVFFGEIINLWDIAAAILIVREAGGQATDFKNNSPEHVESLSSIIVGNAFLHKQIIQLGNKIR